MYYDDFTPYEYAYTGEEVPRPFNIGWLSSSRPFSTGETTEEFKERLFELSKLRFEQTRGYQICEFCWGWKRLVQPQPGRSTFVVSPQVTEQRGEVVLRLGSAEIRVQGLNGKVYAAPNLIYHNVVKHRYKPPEEFIHAVCNLPQTLKPLED